MPEIVVERAVLSVSPDTHDLFTALSGHMKMSFSQAVQTLAMVGAHVYCAADLDFEEADIATLLDFDYVAGMCRAWMQEKGS